jgi:hypothetical protein
MSYVTLKGFRCDTGLNLHASTEDKIDDAKDSFSEKLELVFGKSPK